MFFKSNLYKSYFVSYVYTDTNGFPVFDNVEVKLECEITEFSDVNDLTYKIKKIKNLNCKITILNFILIN